MGKRTLSLYIDESGVLDKENPTSRFYLISFVAHNEDDDVAGKVGGWRGPGTNDTVTIQSRWFGAGCSVGSSVARLCLIARCHVLVDG